MNGVFLCPQRVLPVRGDRVGPQRLCVQATATPQNKGNKGSRTSKTGSSRTGPTSTPTTSPTSSSTPPNVQSAEAQVKAETASPALAQRRAEAQVDTTARRTEAQIDSTADSAKDAAQDTKRQSRQAAAETKRNISGASEDVKEGVDQAADVVADTAESAQQGIDDASEQLQEGIDQTSAQLQQAADQAPEVAADLVQQGVDTVSEGIEQAQDLLEEAQKPGPAAPYSKQRLTVLDSPGPKAGEEDQVKYYKQLLLYSVAGLDRGSAANDAAASEVEIAVSRLQSATSPVVLSWTAEEGKTSTTLAQLNGTWRLIYSSAFQQGGLGNSGLPTLVSPFQLGQVYQNISAYTSRLDNVVELYSKIPVPSLPGFPRPEPVVTTATLRHAFEPIGGSTSQITFEDTEVKTTGGIGGLLGRLPEFSLPQLPRNLRPSREQRTSTFETLYLDDDLRVIRGRRGELRVLVKT